MLDSKTKIIKWLEKKGWSLLFTEVPPDEKGVLCYDTKKIEISKALSKEEQIFILLHECGHILLRQKEHVYENMFPIQSTISPNKSYKKRSRKYKIEILQEEILAWNRGKKLAKRLGIKINNKKWERIKSDCLFTYIEWAAQK